MYPSPIIFGKHVMHTDENTLCTLTFWGFVNAFKAKYVKSEFLGGKCKFFLKMGIGKFCLQKLQRNDFSSPLHKKPKEVSAHAYYNI